MKLSFLKTSAFRNFLKRPERLIKFLSFGFSETKYAASLFSSEGCCAKDGFTLSIFAAGDVIMRKKQRKVLIEKGIKSFSIRALTVRVRIRVLA